MADVMDNKDVDTEYRSFEYEVDGKVKAFYLSLPNSEQIRRAEWHYSKVYNKALVEGVATTPEMMDILTKRGLYGPDFEKKLQELQINITLKIADMQGSLDDAKREVFAREIQQLRDELYRWNQRITGPLSNSCEQMAEDAKTEYLTSSVVHTEGGVLAWPTYESFVTERNQGLALKARFEVLLWLQGLEVDFLDNTPENIVLREIASQKVEDELEASALSDVEKLQLSAASVEEPSLDLVDKAKKTKVTASSKKGRPKKSAVK